MHGRQVRSKPVFINKVTFGGCYIIAAPIVLYINGFNTQNFKIMAEDKADEYVSMDSNKIRV